MREILCHPHSKMPSSGMVSLLVQHVLGAVHPSMVPGFSTTFLIEALCQLLPPALNMNTCWNLTRLHTQCFSLFCPKSSSGHLIPFANIFSQIQCPYKTSSHFYCVANFVLSLCYSQSPNACCYVFLLCGLFFFWFGVFSFGPFFFLSFLFQIWSAP